MKYTLVILTLLFASHLSFAQTEPLEGKENAVELNEEIEGKKKAPMIRSTASVTVSDPPLFIIEGKVADKNTLDNLDPNTIKSVNVIKGDGARAIYGAKGKNGVIVVTLKRKHAKKFKKKYLKNNGGK